MGLFRLYTGTDDRSHVEPIALAKTPDWGKGLATTQISFREDPVGRFIDWLDLLASRKTISALPERTLWTRLVFGVVDAFLMRTAEDLVR